MSERIRMKSKEKTSRQRSYATRYISCDVALYAIRSAQSLDSYLIARVLDPFLAGNSVEGLMAAIRRLQKLFNMDSGDRIEPYCAPSILLKAMGMDRALKFKPRSPDMEIAHIVAAYKWEWEEVRDSLRSDSRPDQAAQRYRSWMHKNRSPWTYAWKRARTHHDVEKEWRLIKRITKGSPKTFVYWQSKVTNIARSIVSRTKDPETREVKALTEAFRAIVKVGESTDKKSLVGF